MSRQGRLVRQREDELFDMAARPPLALIRFGPLLPPISEERRLANLARSAEIRACLDRYLNG